MKSILIISHHLPYRNVCHAGGKKIYDFIVHSKKRNVAVYLVSLALPDELDCLPEMEDLCDGTAFLVSKPVFTEDLLDSFLKHLEFFRRRRLDQRFMMVARSAWADRALAAPQKWKTSGADGTAFLVSKPVFTDLCDGTAFLLSRCSRRIFSTPF